MRALAASKELLLVGNEAPQFPRTLSTKKRPLSRFLSVLVLVNRYLKYVLNPNSILVTALRWISAAPHTSDAAKDSRFLVG